MKRVAEIKAKRERVFYKQRISKAKQAQKAQVLAEVTKNIHLVDAPELKKKVLETKFEAQATKKMEIDMA